MLSVATLEVPHCYGDPAGQLAWIEAHLPHADLVVLPETALTGYVSATGDYDLSAFAETRGGPTEQALVALARKHGRAIVGPLIERDGGACYNSALFVDADGTIVCHYRKRHPWMPETWATKGTQPPPLLSWRGLTFALAICFDVHFLEEDAGDTLRAADALLFPSAWTEIGDTRPQLLPELARHFGCAIVNANWGKAAPRVPGQGNSLIIASNGAVLASGGPVASAVLAPRR